MKKVKIRIPLPAKCGGVMCKNKKQSNRLIRRTVRQLLRAEAFRKDV